MRVDNVTERFRRRGIDARVACRLLLILAWTEAFSFRSNHVSSGGGCTNLERITVPAASSCPRSCRPARSSRLTFMPSCGRSRPWRQGINQDFINHPLDARTIVSARRTRGMACLRENPSPRPLSCLPTVADSSGGLLSSKYSIARTPVQQGSASPGAMPSGNILQRIAMIASERPSARTPSTPTRSSLLSSDPIERFSSSSAKVGEVKITRNHRPYASKVAYPPTSSTPSGGFLSASQSSASMSTAEAAGAPPPSLIERVVAELRSRTLSRRASQGVQQLGSAIAQVETKLSLGSSEAGQLREALETLRSEHESFSREHALTVGRIEAVSREYDNMRRVATEAAADLRRRNERLTSAEREREKTQASLSERTTALANGFGREKQRFATEMREADARQEREGSTAVAAARFDAECGYRQRLRSLSDGLASTQLQLSALKSARDKEKCEATKARSSLEMQVVRLEAQLKRAGEGVEKERTDMEALLLRLSDALSGVEFQLKQSAGKALSRESSRALRKAQEDFRRDQRRVKLLLERQKQRYNAASSVVEEEAERLRHKASEMVSLRAALEVSADKESQLKSNVAALGSRVSSLDKELCKTRAALVQEQELRREAQVALLTSETQWEKETKSLRSELEATRDEATGTRNVYVSTVEQRREWIKKLRLEERAKTEAVERAEANETALRDEVERNRKAAERRERELSELKKQIVRTSRSLALSEAERAAETKVLHGKIDKLNEEASRLGAQVQDGRNLAARAATGVSRRAFLNASQMSQNLAPQGMLNSLSRSINARFRNATSSAAHAPVKLTEDASESGGGRGSGDRGAVMNAPDKEARQAQKRARTLSSQGISRLMVGNREGRKRSAGATLSSSTSVSASELAPPPPPFPTLAERAVRGVLGRVFQSSEVNTEIAKNGVGDDEAASAARQSGQAAAPTTGEPAAANKTPAEKLTPRAETDARFLTAAAATTAVSTGEASRSVVDRFGRSDQGSGKPRPSWPPSTAASATQEMRHVDELGGSSGRMDRRREDLGSTSAPTAETRPGRHRQDVKLSGAASVPGKAIDIIRGPLRIMKMAGRDDGRPEDSNAHRAAEHAGRAETDAGSRIVTVTESDADARAKLERSIGDGGGPLGFFRERFGKGRNGPKTAGSGMDDDLDMIGLGG